MEGIRITALVAGWMLAEFLSRGQEPKSPVIPPPAASANAADAKPATAAHPLEQADLEAFFDGILPLKFERSDIAGA
jgi:hypothetical protein